MTYVACSYAAIQEVHVSKQHVSKSSLQMKPQKDKVTFRSADEDLSKCLKELNTVSPLGTTILRKGTPNPQGCTPNPPRPLKVKLVLNCAHVV